MWQLLLLHAIFASTYTLGKAGLSYVQPVLFVAIRMIACGFLLYLLRLIAGRSFSIKRQDCMLFFSLALFQIYLTYVPEFMVLKYVSSTKWALIYTLTPFCTAIITYFMGKEKMTFMKWIGLTIGFIGILPTLLFNGEGCEWGYLLQISFPEAIIFATMVSYSYGWIVAKKLVKERHYDAMLINSFGMLVGGFGALATSPLSDTWSPSPISEIGPFLGIMSALIIATMLAFNLNTYLLHYYSATFLMFLMFIDPIYVALYGRIFLKEPIAWHFFISVLMVCFGLYLFYREELKEGYTA